MRLGKARTQPEPPFVRPGQVLLTITSSKGNMARLVMGLDDVVNLSNMIPATARAVLVDVLRDIEQETQER